MRFIRKLLPFLFIVVAAHGNDLFKNNVLDLGMALRDRFYPHLNTKELRIFLRHTGRPDDQDFVFAKYRISTSDLKDMEEIQEIAMIVENIDSMESMEESKRKKAMWLHVNYTPIVCRSKLDNDGL